MRTDRDGVRTQARPRARIGCPRAHHGARLRLPWLVLVALVWLVGPQALSGLLGGWGPGWGTAQAASPLPPLVPTDGSGVYRALTDPGDLPRMRLADDSAQLPLRDTKVKVRITGMVAQVEVTQRYANPRKKPIEAVYTFPLPENSAVDDMRIVIGDRVIEAEIEKREQARRTYEAARAQGQTAALLEQERDNVFTQSVANIAPGEDIDVVVRYVQDLTYDAGEYELVFPMVVGPRYVAGTPTGKRSRGTGTKADTDAVPDASRVSPPVAGPGTRTGHDIAIEVVADAGLPIRGFDVPTHHVTGGLKADGTLQVALAGGTSIPNRDFVLRYRVAGQAVTPTLLLHGDDTGGHFTLLVQPPDVDVDDLVGARELIFVVDISGSMSGVPLAICKRAMRSAIRRMRPVDTFDIITFSGGTGRAFGEPRPANDHNLREALAFVDGLRAGGGTEILNAVDEALSGDPGMGRHRYVMFLTDGYVSIEDAVYGRTQAWISALKARGQRARVFALGVGSSINTELLTNLATAGDGLMLAVGTREDPATLIDRVYAKIDHPIWTDFEVDWKGMKVHDVHPAQLPDLFASRPVVVHGRYEGRPARRVGLRARSGGHTVDAVAPMQRVTVAGSVHATLWARARIEDESHAYILDRQPAHVAEITRLGLEHRLVTQYTSFVAVDRTRTVGEGDPEQVVQPVDIPEGVDPVAAGAYGDTGRNRKMAIMRQQISPLSGVGGGQSVYDFEDANVDGELDGAPTITSRRYDMGVRDEDPDEVYAEYEREARGEGGGGCAHCNRRRGGDVAALWMPLLVLGLRRRRRRRSR